MTDETTVKTPSTEKPAPDLAPARPLPPVLPLDTAETPEVLASVAKPAQGIVHLEPVKRETTTGEKLFNLSTYGGFALIGNEITSTAIVRQAGKPNLIGRMFDKGEKFFAHLGKPGGLPYIQKRFNYISFAIIGGFLMVPFIKMLEDHKHACVRFADRLIHGKERADNDPEITKRHQEMDNAPVQTWGSLGRGRLLTVGAAYVVDSTVNWKEGLSARLLKGTRFEKYSSLDHVSEVVADGLNGKLSRWRKLSPEKVLTQRAWLKDLVGLSTLSATLTVLFYASSKIFAAKSEEKREHRVAERIADPKLGDTATMRDIAPEEVITPASDTPRASVSNIAYEKPLINPPAPALHA